MFIEQKANENSYLKRRKKYGVGINDADYFTTIDGQTCPAYKRWNDMMYKTFSKTVEVNTKICKEWLIFSNFRTWMYSQEWQGRVLDINTSNLKGDTFSPDTCLFVDKYIALMTEKLNRPRNSKVAMGVTACEYPHSFVAAVTDDGKRKHLGTFSSEAEAANAYLKEKARILVREAMWQTDPRVKKGLKLHADNLLNKITKLTMTRICLLIK